IRKMVLADKLSAEDAILEYESTLPYVQSWRQIAGFLGAYQHLSPEIRTSFLVANLVLDRISLWQKIQRYYPLSIELIGQLSEHEKQLYDRYHVARIQQEDFDTRSCLSFCNDGEQPACLACRAQINGCYANEVERISLGYANLLDEVDLAIN